MSLYKAPREAWEPFGFLCGFLRNGFLRGFLHNLLPCAICFRVSASRRCFVSCLPFESAPNLR